MEREGGGLSAREGKAVEENDVEKRTTERNDENDDSE